MRPEKLERMCFAQFATSYTASKNVKDNTFSKFANISEETSNWKIFETNEPLPKFILLKDGTTMRLRQQLEILRIHASRHKATNHEQVYSELLLYLPWRNESDLFPEIYSQPENDKKCKDLYKLHEILIDSNRKRIFPFSKTIEVIHELYSNDYERPAHFYENLDPEGQQDNLEALSEMEPLDTTELPEEVDPSNNIPRPKATAKKKENIKIKEIKLDDPRVMIENARNLSFSQKVVFNDVIDFCKRTEIQMTGTPIYIKPLRRNVTGEYSVMNFSSYKQLFQIQV